MIDDNRSPFEKCNVICVLRENLPDSKVYGANMGLIWGRQDPGGPHVGPMNLAIWASPTGVSAVPADSLAPLVMTFRSGMIDL